MRLMRWLRHLLADSHSAPTGSSWGQSTRVELDVVRLEERLVLNASPLATLLDLDSGATDAPDQTTIDAGDYSDDGAADRFLISQDGADLNIDVNGLRVFTAEVDRTEALVLKGSSDADEFVFDFGGQPAVFSFEIIIDAGSSETDSGDALRITNGTADNVTYQLANDADFLAIDHHNVTLIGVDSIVDELVVDVRQIVVTTDDTNLRIASAGEGYSQIADRLEFSNANDRLEIVVDNDVATDITIDGLDSGFSGDLLVFGSTDDAIEFAGATEGGDIAGGESVLNSVFGGAGGVSVTGDLTADGDIILNAGAAIDVSASANITSVSGGVYIDATHSLTVAGNIQAANVSDGIGGTIHLLGDSVWLSGEATIDASGAFGGGTVLIGGDYLGSNDLINNSQRTIVGQDVTVAADALIEGDGGRVIVWSDIDTFADGSGNISARGGELSGDGGFIETSGKSYLRIGSATDASATNGSGGTWLLDPSNLTIVAGSTSLLTGTNPMTYSPTSNTNIGVDEIIAALESGVSVTLSTASAGGSSGDVSIQAAIIVDSYSGAMPIAPDVTLTILADDDIRFTSTGSIVNDTSSGGPELSIVLTAGVTQTDGDIAGTTQVSVAGTATFSATDDITLTNATNDFSDVLIESANAVSLVDANGLTVGGATAVTGNISGTLSIDATSIGSGSHKLSVSGVTTLDVSGSIVLNNAANDFGTVTIANGVNVTLVDVDNIVLGASGTGSDVTGFLSVTATSITDSSELIVDGITTLNATGNITLDDADHDFATLIVENGANVEIVDTNGIIIGGEASGSISGTLDVTADSIATAALADGDQLVVSGLTTLTASGNIALTHASNNFAGVLIDNGTNVSLVDVNGIVLSGTGNGDDVDGTLDVKAGSITATTELLVAGITTLEATGNITLTDADNDFTTLLIKAGLNVAIVDTDALTLGGVALTAGISGTLDVESTSLASGGTEIVVVGTTTLDVSGNITLDDADNDFASVIIQDGNNVEIVDVNGLAIGGDTATSGISGTLDLTATAITSAGDELVVSGETTLNATTGDITLDHADNNFASVIVTKGVNVDLVDVNGIVLGGSSAAEDVTVTGTLDVKATSITDGTGSLLIGGTTTLDSSGSISLNNTANDFAAVHIKNGTFVTLVDINALAIGSVAGSSNSSLTLTATSITSDGGQLVVTGTTSVNATGDVTLNHANNDFASVLIRNGQNVTLVDVDDISLRGTGTGSDVTGTLNVTAGSISATTELLVDGITTLAATGDITLTDVDNEFSTVIVNSAANVELVDSDGILIGGDGVGTITGTLDVTAVSIGTAAAADGDELVVAGLTTVTASGNITLDHADNDFAGVLIDNGTNVSLVDVNNIALSGTGGGDDVDGTLDVKAGSITATTELLVAGITTLEATGAITLTDVDNDFTTVLVKAGTNVAIVDEDSLTLGGVASTAGISGTLDVKSTSLADGGSEIVVVGVTTLDVTGNITLDDVDNDFATVIIKDGNNVEIVDVNAIAIGGDTATSGISGTLDLTATSITSAGDELVVVGQTTLDATGNITLNHADNDFGTVQISNGADVTLVDATAIVLQGTGTGADVTGNLSVTAASISANTHLEVTGTTTLDATSGNITLVDADNEFGTIILKKAVNVTIVDVSGITVGGDGTVTSVISGTLSLTATSISSGANELVVTGTTTLNSSGDITLDNANNDFNTVTIANGEDVTLVDVDDIVLRASGGGSDVTGFLNVKATSITDGSNLIVDGITTLDATGDITLDNTSHDFSTLIIKNGANVEIFDTNAVLIGGDAAGAITGTLTVTADSIATAAPADGDQLVVAGLTTLSATGDITLDHADNNFAGVLIDNGANVTLVDVDNISLSGTGTGDDVTGTLDVKAASITTTTELVVAGTTTVEATGDITLDDVDNDFATVLVKTGANVVLVDVNSLTLGGVAATTGVSGTLDVTATSVATGGAEIVVAGITTLDVTGNITLSDANNDFSTVVIKDGHNVSIVDVNALAISGDTLTTGISGTLALTASAITDTGDELVVAGETTLSATTDITLDNAANNFSSVIVSNAVNVELVDVDGIVLGGSSASESVNITGTLDVLATSITSGVGEIVVGGTTTLDSAGVITLDNAANDFNEVHVKNGTAVTLVDVNGLAIGSVAGSSLASLTLTATDITSVADQLVVTGATSLDATGDITLNNADNDFAGVLIRNGQNVTLVDVDDISLSGTGAGSDVTGTLNISAGAISSTTELIVDGTTTLASTGNIDLTDPDNDFSTVIVSSAVNVALVDTDDLTLNASVMTGTLDVTADGTIGNGGVLDVGGNATFATADGNSILLNGAVNKFAGTIGFTSTGSGNLQDVAISNEAAVNLVAMTIDGNLTAVSQAGIVASGILTIGGTTSFDAAPTANVVAAQDNAFTGSVSVLNGFDATINSIGTLPLDLGTVNVDNDLFVTAKGDISDSGTITIGRNSTLTTDGGQSIELNSAANQFNGSVTFTSATLTELQNVAIVDVDTTALDLAAMTLTGTLSVNSAAGITSAGALVVDGTAAFEASDTANITLTNNNDFKSSVSVTGGNVTTISDLNTITLGTSTVGGSLFITSGTDAVTPGTITVSGNVTNAAAGSFDMTLTAQNAGDIIVTGDVDTNGGTFTTNGNAFTGTGSHIQTATADFNHTGAVVLGQMTVTTLLDVTSGSTITDTGVLDISGTTTLTAGTVLTPADITLDSANDFTGAVSVVAGNNVELRDTNAIALGSAPIAGTLTVTADGAITNSGTLTVAGHTTLTAGSSGDITFSGVDTDFSTIDIVSGQTVTLHDTNNITVGNASFSDALTVTADNDIILTNSVVSTTATALSLTAGASVLVSSTIASSSVMNVTLAAGAANSVTVSNDVNTGGGDLVASGQSFVGSAAHIQTGAGSATLNFSSTVGMGQMTVDGDLTVAAGADITNGSILDVNGNASFTTASGSSVLLTNVANRLSGPISFVSSGVTDLLDVTLANVTDVTLAALSLDGNLVVTSQAAISDSGSLTVDGTTTLTAGSTSDITLTQNNDFGLAVTIVSGEDVTLNDTDNILIGGSTIGGLLTVTAGGDVTQSGTLSVAGTATVDSAGAITLTDAGNDFNTFAIAGGTNVAIVDANAISLSGNSSGAGIDVSGNLDVTATSIGSGADRLEVTGTTTLNSVGNITLNNADNDFGSVVISNGVNVTFVDANNIILNGNAAGVGIDVSGTLDVTAGSISGGAFQLDVAGTTTLDSSGDISLTHLSNDFSSVAIANGANVTLVDVNGIVLSGNSAGAGVDVTGTLTVSATSIVGGTDRLEVAGTTTLSSVGDITLTNTNNDFADVVIATAVNVDLADATAIGLSGTATGTLNVNAASMTNAAALTVGGNTTLNATGDITLNNAANDFNHVAIANGTNVALVDVDDISISGNSAGAGVDVSGTLSVTATSITGGPDQLEVTGTTTLTSTGVVTLTHANNDFGTVSVLSATDVNLVDANGLTLGTSDVGSLTVTASGDIGNSGTVRVTGDSLFTSSGGSSIMLDGAVNDFVGAVTFASAGRLHNIALDNLGDINLAATSISGNLNVVSQGSVTGTGILTIDGTTTAEAGAASNVVLGQSNVFGSAVNIVDGFDVTVNSAGGVDLGIVRLRNDLSVVAAGNITNSGLMTVDGDSFYSTSGGSAIFIDNAGNTFGGSLSFTSTTVGVNLVDVSIRDTDASAVDLQAMTLDGNLTVRSAAGINGVGNLSITGTTTLETDSGSVISLTAANDFVNAVSVTGGNSVTIHDQNTILIGASSLDGTLNILAGLDGITPGTITTNGVIASSGAGSVDVNLTAFNSGGIVIGANIDTNGGTLTTSGSSFDSTSAHIETATADLNHTGSVTLGQMTVATLLDVTSGGTISDAGDLDVNGATVLQSGTSLSPLDIQLDNANDFTGTVTISAANNATLNDINAIELGSAAVVGNLSVTSAGAITGSNTVTVGGLATLAAGSANNITLSGVNNDFSTVDVGSGSTVTLNDTNTILIGNVNVASQLLVTADEDIVVDQTVSSTSATDVSLTAGESVYVNNAITSTSAMNVTLTAGATGFVVVSQDISTAGGDFTATGQVYDATGGHIQTAAGDASLNFSDSVALGQMTVNGTLTVVAGSTITNGGVLDVDNGASFTTADGSSILLTNTGNQLSGNLTFASSGAGNLQDVTISNVTAVTLQSLSLDGNLVVNSQAGIVDTGALSVAGTTTLSAASASDITLTQANNFGQAVSISSANNVALNDVDGIILGTSTLAGTLDVTANGTISDAGNLTIAGITTLDAGTNTITLDASHDFQSAVRTVNGSDVTLNDINEILIDTTSVSGAFNVSAFGTITDAGAIDVAGTTTLTSQSDAITFDNTANDFNVVAIGNATTATIVDTDDLTLGTIVVTSAIEATSGAGSAGDLTIGGTIDGGFNAINVSVTANDGSAVHVNADVNTQGGSFTSTGLGTGATTFDSTGVHVQTGTGNITIDHQSGSVILGQTSSDGNLSVTSDGTITDSGSLSVVGLTTVTAGNNDITLDDGGNNFGNISVGSGKIVSINDGVGDLIISAIDFSEAFTANSAGTISTGAAVSTSNTVAATLSLNAGSGITIDHAISGPAAGLEVSLTASGNVDVNADIDTGGANFSSTSTGFGSIFDNTTAHLQAADVVIDHANGSIVAGQITADNLQLTAGGTITNSGSLIIGDTTTIHAGTGNDVQLNNSGNDFATVVVASGLNVELVDVNDIILGASTVTASLTVSVADDIGNAGVLTVGGDAFFTTSENQSINLDGAINNIAGGINFLSTGPGRLTNVAINNLTDVTLDTLSISGTLDVNSEAGIIGRGALTVDGAVTLDAVGNILLDQSNILRGVVTVTDAVDATITTLGNVDLGSVSVQNDLSVVSSANITNSGIIAVANNASFAAGGGSSIAIDQANTFGGTVTFASTTIGVDLQNVSIRDTDTTAIDLQTLTLAGNLDVNSNGGITDSGNLSVLGTTNLQSDNTSVINLNSANDFVGNVSITGGSDVSLSDVNSISIGASTVAGPLTVTSGTDGLTAGQITIAGTIDSATASAFNVNLTAQNSGSIVVSGDVDANGGTVTTTGGSFNSAGSHLQAGLVFLDQSDAVILGQATVSTLLSVTSDGTIAGSEALDVNGVTVLSAGSSVSPFDIQLDGANDFSGSVAITNANNATLNDVNAIDFGASTISGTLNVTSDGLISNSGGLNVTGQTTLSAGAGNSIVLTNSDFNTVSILQAADATLGDTDDINLGTTSLTGSLTVTSVGAITDSGAVSVAGASSFNAGATNDVTLDDAGNDFDSVSVLAGRNITVVDSNSLAIDTSTISGNLSLTTSGDLTQTGLIDQLDAASATSIHTTGGDITLSNAANQFAGTVSLTTIGGSNVDLTAAGTLRLGSSNVSDGTIQFVADDINVENTFVADDGHVTLQATNTVAVNSSVTTFDANVTVTAAAGVSLATAGSITSGGGDVDLTAGTSGVGEILMSDGALITTDSGSIDLDSTDNITLAGLTTTSGSLSVTTTAGAIVDGGDTHVDLVSVTGTATLSALSIGTEVDVIETTVGTLDATATNGGIYVHETDDLTLGTVAANGVDADIGILSHTGTITTSSVTATDHIQLTASLGSIVDDGTASALTTADSITLTTAADVGSAANSFNTDVNTVTANAANVSLSNANDLLVTSVTATDSATLAATSGDITVAAISTGGNTVISAVLGSVLGDASGGTNINAVGLGITATNDIGGTDALVTNVTTLAASTASGDINVDNVSTGGLSIGSVGSTTGLNATGGGGSIAVAHAGELSVNSTVTNSGGGDVSLTSNGLFLNSDISLAGGNGDATLVSSAGLDVAAVVSTSGSGLIRPQAVDGITFDTAGSFTTPNGIARSETPLLENIVTPTITSTGEARVTGSFGVTGEENFDITVDWSDGTVITYAFVNPGTFDLTHTFLTNPADQGTAYLDIIVTLTRGANLNGDDSTTISSEAELPIDGIVTAVLISSPEVDTSVVVIHDTVEAAEQTASSVAVTAAADDAPAMVEDVVSAETRVLLRVISESGEIMETIPLSEETLDNIPQLLNRLPDGRYSISIQEAGDQRERLVMDLNVREGKAADDTASTRTIQAAVDASESVLVPVPGSDGLPADPQTDFDSAGLEVFNSLGESEWLTGAKLAEFWDRWDQVLADLRASDSPGESTGSSTNEQTNAQTDDLSAAAQNLNEADSDNNAESNLLPRLAAGVAGVGGAWLLARQLLKRSSRSVSSATNVGTAVITQNDIDELRATSKTTTNPKTNSTPEPEVAGRVKANQ